MEGMRLKRPELAADGTKPLGEDESVKAVWTPQPGPQTFAVMCPADLAFFGGSRGGGKMLSNSSKILTPKGWTTHGEVKVGDCITNPDGGGSQFILGVFPQGEMDMYRVRFDDGAEVFAGLEHYWAYKCANRLRPNTKKSSQREFLKSLGYGFHQHRFSKLRVGTTADMVADLNVSGNHNPRIPLTDPVLFTVNGRIGSVDPYLIGLMLGDGSFGRSGWQMTVGDQEIADYLISIGFYPSGSAKVSNGVLKGWYLPTSDDSAKKVALSSKAFGWALRHGLSRKVGAAKFIPGYVFTANVEYRLAVLQGLLDSDGYVDDRGHIEFTNVSEHLVRGVADLVRSFGGKATVSEPIIGSYRNDLGERVECQEYRRVYIQSDLASYFFRLQRKSSRCVNRWNGGHENMRKVISIEYSHREEATCIKVSSPHGLYITDDYIVTHNTDCAIGKQIVGGMTHGYNWNGLFLRKNFKHFNDLRRRVDNLIMEGLPAERVGGDHQTNTIKFFNGARVLMTAIERSEQLDFFQGQAFCVAEGTRITMGDGSPCKIEDIVVGERVMTMEGPRRVTGKMPSQVKDCVKAQTPYGTQMHPSNHPVFSISGWQSYSSILENGSRDAGQNSRGQCGPESVEVHAALFRPSLQSGIPGSGLTSTLSHTFSGFCRLLEARTASLLSFLSNLPHTVLQELLIQDRLLRQCVLSVLLGERRYAPSGCTVPDFLSGYSVGPHQGGEQFQIFPGTFRGRAPFQGDALGSSSDYLYNLRQGAQEHSGSRSDCSSHTYVHPYTGEARSILGEIEFEACRITPVGKKVVYDISVEEVNHYIAHDSKLVNRNSLICIEEACQFSFVDEMIDKLKGCLRSAAGVPCQMFLTGNPGGPGHSQIKNRFINPSPGGGVPIMDGEDTAMFIPSNVVDNVILCKNDPKYVGRLRSIKDESLRKAWLEGDWNVVLGGFFDDVWDQHKNVLSRFKPPKHWPRLCGMDWGTARPFSVGWFAVADGERVPGVDVVIPRGAIVMYDEWYGCTKGEINTGLRLTSSQVAAGILERERARGEDLLIFDRVADTSIFDEDDGPSIGERFAQAGVVWRKSDKRRIPGWENMRDMLRGVAEEDAEGRQSYTPMFYVTDNCRYMIDLLPTMQRDENNWDDMDSDGPDHCIDMARYALMSRPSAGITKEEHLEEKRKSSVYDCRSDWDEIVERPSGYEDWGVNEEMDYLPVQ